MIDSTRICEYKHNIVKFAEDHFFLSPNKTIKLWDYQKEILHKCTERDEEGNYLYKISIVSMPRQNSKSVIATILGLHSLFFGGYNHQILSVGIGGRDVAKVIFNKARIAIMNNLVLFESIGDRSFGKQEITVPETQSVWQISSTEMLSSLGRAFDLVLFDEMGNERVHLNEAGVLWDSISAGQAAKSNARSIITSTVGGQIGKMYELMQIAPKESYIYLYYTKKNLSPLITQEYLDRRRKELHHSVYSHWHENEHFTGADSFIHPELWDSCINDLAHPVPIMPKNVPSVCWLDIGLKRDISAAVTVYRDPENKFCIAEIKTWSPLISGEIQLEWLEQYLIEAQSRLNHVKVYIDAWQAASTVQKYGRKLNLEAVHLTADKLEQIWQNFLARMQNREIVLWDDKSSDYREMRREALNLTIEPKGAGFKIVDKGSTHQDRVLAFAGAVWKMTSEFESELYNLGMFNCPIMDKRKSPCPLRDPEYFFEPSCYGYGCELYLRGYAKYAKAMNIENPDITKNIGFRKWIESIKGFRFSGGVYRRS